MNISFYTFGCTVNNYETQKMRELFSDKGYQIVEGGDADVIIINSCAVTTSVENGVIELFKRIRKKNPEAIIALVGCYGELKKKKSELQNSDIIWGNNKFDIINEIDKVLKIRKMQQINHKVNKEPINLNNNSSIRAFLQIQNGCNNYCTYCIVPYLRGKHVSYPLSEIKAELNKLVSAGCKEIVVAGINLGLYNDKGYTFMDVLEQINAMDGVESIRLSSLEPMTLDYGFIDRILKISKLQPHLHISLQSGSDKILSLMNRHYTFNEYLSLITEIRKKINGISITTDVIVGFPGESDNDFKNSCNNIIKCQFSDIHIFKYSKRSGTIAADMPEQTSTHEKLIRSNYLNGIKSQACYSYNSQFIGFTQKVTVFKKHSKNLWEGVTPHNIKIFIKSEDNNISMEGIYNVKITGIHDNGEALIGFIVI